MCNDNTFLIIQNCIQNSFRTNLLDIFLGSWRRETPSCNKAPATAQSDIRPLKHIV